LKKSEEGLTLILLAYNEETKVVQSIKNYLQQLSDTIGNYELIVVNDGSVDNTAALIQPFNQSITIINNNKNLGFAVSLKKAITNSKYDKFFWMGADNPDRNLIPYINSYKSSKTSISYLTVTDYKNRYVSRAFLSKSYTAIVNFLFRLNVPYYNGRIILSQKNFDIRKICNSRFALAQMIILQLRKNKFNISSIEENISINDKDVSSESIPRLISTTLVDLLIFRLKTIFSYKSYLNE